jgi:hypothetical protein
MKYYLFWTENNYSDEHQEVFDLKQKVLDFINYRASNPNAKFRVIYGEELELNPVSIVQGYKFKER